jgi:hypothetical protein
MTIVAAMLFLLQIESRAPEMYSAILEQTKTFKDRVIVIESVSLAIPRITANSNTSWRAQFNGWPAELMAVLEGRGQAPAVGPFEQEEVPTGTRLILRSEIFAGFNPSDQLASWSRIERIIGAHTWQAFSRLVLSADGLQALVYAEHHCGGGCAHGNYVWLSRRDTRDRWRVTRQVVNWIA